MGIVNDMGIVLVAVERNAGALQFASEELREDTNSYKCSCQRQA